MADKRINELPPLLVLSLNDLLPIWHQADNKTYQVPLQSLNNFFATGGNAGTTPPVYDGGSLIYIVPDSAVGTNAAAIPSIAGLSFRLRRNGIPLIPQVPVNDRAYPRADAEFETLDAGGFVLLQPNDLLAQGERFELEFYQLISGAPGSGTVTGTGGSFITGLVEITANTTVNSVNHLGKLLQLRGDATPLTITLPDITTYPANAIIPIEASILNTVQHTIATSSGQFIYLRNSGKVAVYISPGEVLWLQRATDGWYVINDFWRSYAEIGRPYAAYKAELGELVCKGQLLKRSEYPRLWEWVQGLASSGSLVTEAQWNTPAVYYYNNAWSTTAPGSGVTLIKQIDRPYRGCFSQGTVSTGADANFRIPDLMEQFLRALKSEIGNDPERFYNKTGGAQQDENKAHTHTAPAIPLNVGDNDRGGNSSLFSLDNQSTPNTGSSGGNESRPKNVGMLWLIKY